MDRRDVVWAVAFEQAMARACMKGDLTFVAPDVNVAAWARNWANHVVFYFDRHGRVAPPTD